MKMFKIVSRNTAIEIICALFILLFVYTGINKIIEIKSLQDVMKDYPLLKYLPSSLMWGIPIFELVISALLLIPRLKIWGLYLSFGTMLFFTVYVSYMLVFLPSLPCTCGGMLMKLSWPQHLIFNIVFTLFAMYGIHLYRRDSKPNTRISKIQVLPG